MVGVCTMFTRRKCIHVLEISVVYPKKKKKIPWVRLLGYSLS